MLYIPSRYGLRKKNVYNVILFSNENIKKNLCFRPLEVCVEGRRLGATKNCRNSGRLMICKMEFLRFFLSVSNNNNLKEMSYKSLKALAKQYNDAWMQGKSALKVWTSKPSHLEDFKIDS